MAEMQAQRPVRAAAAATAFGGGTIAFTMALRVDGTVATVLLVAGALLLVGGALLLVTVFTG